MMCCLHLCSLCGEERGCPALQVGTDVTLLGMSRIGTHHHIQYNTQYTIQYMLYNIH